MVHRAFVGLAALIVTGLLAAHPAHPQSACQALKFKAAGAAARSRAICLARAAKAGAAVDPSCLTKASEALARRWAAAEAKGDCVTTGDQAAGASAVQQCTDDIAAVVDPTAPPTPVCCNLADTCVEGLDAEACGVLGGTAGAAGSVCDGPSGTCVPPSGPVCCTLADSCAHGLDAETCGTFGGTVGAAGSVCNGATGACGPPPAAAGRCCMTAGGTFCSAGPTLDLSGCVPPSFLDFIVGICSPSGACVLP